MIETEMQSLVVAAVATSGGRAQKLSNRFIIGVADLLVKLPRCPAGLIEVKRYDFGRFDVKHRFKLDVTALQKRFLEEFQNAGMPAGIASFMQQKGKGLKSLRLTVYTLDEAKHNDYTGASCDHLELGLPEFRNERINQYLGEWMETWHVEGHR